MNERIEKLVTASFPGTSLGVLMMYSPELEKFAELIVRECASMARVFNSHEYDFTGDLELDEFMLKHFGVEEKEKE